MIYIGKCWNVEGYSCLENPHGQRNLGVYSSWGCKELDTTEWLNAARHSTGYQSHEARWDHHQNQGYKKRTEPQGPYDDLRMTQRRGAREGAAREERGGPTNVINVLEAEWRSAVPLGFAHCPQACAPWGHRHCLLVLSSGLFLAHFLFFLYIEQTHGSV